MAITASCLSSRSAINQAGDAFKEASDDSRAVGLVQQYREFRLNCLTTSINILNRAGLPPAAFVSARLKRLGSIYRKLTRPNNNFKLGELDDIIGLRVICRSFTEAQELSRRIAQLSENHNTKDYTTQGVKASGYRSVHHIMRFSQKLDESVALNVRFEIQVRSFYQHQWAVWLESHGENAKLDFWGDDEDTPRKLRDLSDRIRQWENRNPDVEQDRLVPYSGGGHVLTVVWKHGPGDISLERYDNTQNAVDRLNRLETKYPTKRNNALLLVGISGENAEYVLARTHPLYVIGNVPSPDTWMPKE